MKFIKKRILFILIAVLLLAAIPFQAFADVNNGPKGGTSAPSSQSSTEDARALYRRAYNCNSITAPSANDYLESPYYAYICAPKEHSILGYKTYDGQEKNKIDTPYHGSKVIVVAYHGEFTCITFHTQKNQIKACWVNSEYLSSVYPGPEYYMGSGKNNYRSYYAADPEVSWSTSNYYDGKVKYTLLKQPVSNCVGLTIDYQVTSRNGADTKACYGDREVYVNDGGGWEYMGSFSYDSMGCVHAVLQFPEPIAVQAVACVSRCSGTGTYIFRQNVEDVLVVSSGK